MTTMSEFMTKFVLNILYLRLSSYFEQNHWRKLILFQSQISKHFNPKKGGEWEGSQFDPTIPFIFQEELIQY